MQATIFSSALSSTGVLSFSSVFFSFKPLVASSIMFRAALFELSFVNSLQFNEYIHPFFENPKMPSSAVA